MVVDHPEGTEVFVDERFAVPPPKLAVVATGPVQPMASVHDDQGHDVSELASARDNRFVDFAGRGEYQGITRRHFVESNCPSRRRDPVRCGSSRRAGCIRPTARSTSRSRRARTRRPRACRSKSPTRRAASGPCDGPRLPVRQGQDDARSTSPGCSAAPDAAPAPRDQPRNLLGSPGLGRRAS